MRVLEIACGTGVVTRRLRQSLPAGATLVATDLNEPMIDYARSVVDASGISWQQADAQALPFPDGSFDLVVCQFGFMFLPDKVQGFREARRVLAADGVLLANVWNSLEANPPAQVIHTTVTELFPADPPTFMHTPYGYHDPDRIRRDMTLAGWETIQLETVRVQSRGPSAEDFARGFAFGSPLTHELVERAADPHEIMRMFERGLIPLGGDRPFTAELSATIVQATRT